MYTPEDFDTKTYDTTHHDTTGIMEEESQVEQSLLGVQRQVHGGKNSSKKDSNTYDVTDHKKPNVSASSAENYSVLNSYLFIFVAYLCCVDILNFFAKIILEHSYCDLSNLIGHSVVT